MDEGWALVDHGSIEEEESRELIVTDVARPRAGVNRD